MSLQLDRHKTCQYTPSEESMLEHIDTEALPKKCSLPFKGSAHVLH